MSLKNFTQFTPQTLLSATDYLVGYRSLDEIRTDLNSMSLGVSAQLISKGFLPGTILGNVKRDNFIYTIASGNNLNAVSGFDDNNRYLSYTPKQVEVYRNGSHLVDNQDFQAINSTQITNLSTLNVGDVIEVVGLSGIGATLQTSLTGFIGNLVQQNYRYSVAPGNTITPGSTVISGPDDFRSNLFFSTKCFQVYLNGSHLVKDYDYSSYNLGSSLTLATPVSTGDSVVVLSLSACAASSLNTVSAFTGISKILGGDRVTVSSGTGNVTVSSQTCISDILVPSWTDGKHISQFSLLQNYLSAVAASNTSPANAVSVENVTKFSGSTMFEGATLAPNGCLYLPPGDGGANVIAKFNPNDNSVSTVTTIAIYGSRSYTGSVLHPNGRIYLIAHDATVFRLIDPSNDTVTTFGTYVINPVDQDSYSSGVVAPNGKIYCSPHDSTIIRVIDPNNNNNVYTLSIGHTTTAQATFGQALMSPQGKVYMIPNNHSIMITIDPATDVVNAVYTVPAGTGIGTGYGAVLAPNGSFYITTGTNWFTKFNPNNNTATTFAGFAAGSSKGVLHPNGKIYFSSTNATQIVIIDPSNDTSTVILTGIPLAAYNGIKLLPNGRMFLVPYTATAGTYINNLTNNNFNVNVCTNPFINTN